MKLRLSLAAIVLLCCPMSAFAHRLDEYLQAAMFNLDGDHAALSLRLTPGVEVIGKVLAVIDLDSDGGISASEQRDYVEKVRGDLSLAIDGRPVTLQLCSFTFPPLAEIKQGLGEIVIEFVAPIPSADPGRASGPSAHRIVFENRHFPAISVYLVNCFAPSDPTISVIAQDRNYTQSYYRLDFEQDVRLAAASSLAAPPLPSRWTDSAGSESLFWAYVYQGVHHILTGYDHLLFVTALVLAATSLWDLVKVVAAFTLAHTLTLTLAAMNIIRLRPEIVEPFIAGSIVFIALQNVFWPRQAKGWTRLGAAFFFGLFHGLGFAGGLLDAMREMQGGTMFLAIFAFSIGVEAGHQMVVLPLFAALKVARRSCSGASAQAFLSTSLLRIGSAGISVAGLYYLCLAIR